MRSSPGPGRTRSSRSWRSQASIPVINGLTLREHPCQALADVFTIGEHLGGSPASSVAFVGDGNNVYHSLALLGAAMGMEIRLAHPAGYAPNERIVARARELAPRPADDWSSGPIRSPSSAAPTSSTRTPGRAMGQEAEAEERRDAFAGYQVNEALMEAAGPDADRDALPAGPSRRGDHLGGHGRPAQPHLRPVREPAPRPEGAARRAARQPGRGVVSDDLFERYKDALRRGHVAALPRSARGGAQSRTARPIDLAPDRVLPYTGLGGVLVRLARTDEAAGRPTTGAASAPRDETSRARPSGRPRRRGSARWMRPRPWIGCRAMLDDEGRLSDACDAAREGLDLAESRERRADVEAFARRCAAKAGIWRPRSPSARHRDPARTGVPPATVTTAGVGPDPAGSDAQAPDRPGPPGLPIRAARSDREELLVAAEAAIDSGDLDAVRTTALAASAAQRREGLLDAALDTCYLALAIAPADPAIHLALAELYLDRGWRVSAVDKMHPARPARRPDRRRGDPRPARDCSSPSGSRTSRAWSPVRMNVDRLTVGGPGPPDGAMLHSEAMPELLRSILEQVRLTTVVDIGLTALLIYWLFSLIRGTRAVRLVIGVSVLFIVYVLAVALDLRLLTRILEAGAVVGLFALVVVFQPELRRALERIGRVGSFGWLLSPAESRAVGHVAAEVAKAAAGLSADGHGALIVLERETGLEEVAETGVMIHGDVSADLLRTIFAPRTALHDGAVVIRGETIVAAGATLPLADTTVHTERFGTRHRAALGIAEQTDASSSSCPRRTARSASSSGPGSSATSTSRSSPGRSARCWTRTHGRRSAFVWRPGGDSTGTAGRSPRLRDLGRSGTRGTPPVEPTPARPPADDAPVTEAPVRPTTIRPPRPWSRRRLESIHRRHRPQLAAQARRDGSVRLNTPWGERVGLGAAVHGGDLPPRDRRRRPLLRPARPAGAEPGQQHRPARVPLHVPVARLRGPAAGRAGRGGEAPATSARAWPS